MTSLRDSVASSAVGLRNRRWLTIALLAAATLSLAVACEDDPEVDETLDSLPTEIGTADIPADEADAEFTLTDTAIEPANVSLQPAGVVLLLSNEGTREHAFVMVDSEDTYELDELPLTEGGEVATESLTVLGEVEPFPAGETRTATAQLEAGKRYIVFCDIPGHYQSGVRAEIEVAGG